MPTFTNLGLAEPSTATARVATVQVARGSTNEQQEILCLGDPDSSNAIAAVLNATPASTAWGLAVRDVVPQSTIVSIGAGNSSVWQGSTAWQVQITNTPSVTIAGNSTAVIASGNSSVIITSGNSSVIVTSGNITIAGNSSVWQGSSAWQVQVTNTPTVSIQGNSTSVIASGNSSVIVTSGNSSVTLSGFAAGLASSGYGAGGIGLLVQNIQIVTASKTANLALASTADVTVVSSVAAQAVYVYAWSGSIGTTNAAGTFRLMDGSTTVLWQVPTVAQVGWNLAVTPPQYLLKTATASFLNVSKAGSSVFSVTYNVSYWQA